MHIYIYIYRYIDMYLTHLGLRRGILSPLDRSKLGTPIHHAAIQELLQTYRGTSLIENRRHLGPYARPKVYHTLQVNKIGYEQTRRPPLSP